jgi:hypothetical protein
VRFEAGEYRPPPFAHLLVPRGDVPPTFGPDSRSKRLAPKLLAGMTLTQGARLPQYLEVVSKYCPDVTP